METNSNDILKKIAIFIFRFTGAILGLILVGAVWSYGPSSKRYANIMDNSIYDLTLTVSANLNYLDSDFTNYIGACSVAFDETKILESSDGRALLLNKAGTIDKYQTEIKKCQKDLKTLKKKASGYHTSDKKVEKIHNMLLMEIKQAEKELTIAQKISPLLPQIYEKSGEVDRLYQEAKNSLKQDNYSQKKSEFENAYNNEFKVLAIQFSKFQDELEKTHQANLFDPWQDRFGDLQYAKPFREDWWIW